MRIVILTSSLYGTAAHHLPLLLESKVCSVAMVIRSQQVITNKRKYYLRKIHKLFRIGLLGALNGIRMRKWYHEDTDKYLKLQSLEVLCKQNGIPFFTVPTVNSKETIALFNQANADLGISLGNGYITEQVFTIPTYGMLNIHHEVLPAYQNAQSIIWQIYNESVKTGYSIHKIDNKIDTGEIVYQEEVDISFRKTFSDTVAFNYARLFDLSAQGLIVVLRNFRELYSTAKTQGVAARYTTPSVRQYITMYNNYKKIKKFNQ
jgi:methionyl-tRNA formyltransferase